MAERGHPQPLSAEQVRAVARLARLELSEDRIQQLRGELGAVLAYMDALREVDVDGVEPMTHPNDALASLDEDKERTSSETLSTDAFMAIAPETTPPFVSVPKVIGEGGGA
jgi:aspartyl-tRNA(Asn)/glutamyl-tRNA(Gln) amidotransferase subunit C